MENLPLSEGLLEPPSCSLPEGGHEAQGWNPLCLLCPTNLAAFLSLEDDIKFWACHLPWREKAQLLDPLGNLQLLRKLKDYGGQERLSKITPHEGRGG